MRLENFFDTLDGQIESLSTEMQNVIGQNREGSTQIKELNEKVTTQLFPHPGL